MRKPPLLRRRCPRWYGGPQSLAPSQIPLFHFHENCCPPGVPPGYAGGTSRPLFHLCSTCGPAKRGEVERPQALALSQKSGPVPLGPSKNNIPSHPRATAPLWPCVGFSRAGWKPAAEATSERVAGTGEQTALVILNEVKNPLSPPQADRNGIWRTDPSTSLCSAQDDNGGRLEQTSLGTHTEDGFAKLSSFTRPRRGKQSRRLSTACRSAPGRSPDPLLFTKRREEMKSNSQSSQKFYYIEVNQYV